MTEEKKPPEPAPDEDQPEPPVKEPPTEEPPVEEPPPRNRRYKKTAVQSAWTDVLSHTDARTSVVHDYQMRPRRSETARSFSGANSPNLEALTLSRGQKKASRLRPRLLTKTVG